MKKYTDDEDFVSELGYCFDEIYLADPAGALPSAPPTLGRIPRIWNAHSHRFRASSCNTLMA